MEVIIQESFHNFTNSRRIRKDSASFFAKLNWEDKVSVALKMLSRDYDTGVLKLDNNVLEELKLKHPTLADVKEESLLHGGIKIALNCYLNDINEIMVRGAASCISFKRLWCLIKCRFRSFLPYAIEQNVQSKRKTFKRTNCFISKNISIDFCKSLFDRFTYHMKTNPPK